ncbi:hypothetical protein EI42_00854 [Thermosporothrix hazakensis]|uniref:Uncharacterized protein n=2 Tax=Thermosporothrix TaxID=768650 RepID=A0A326UF66_THEHA|nr:hypothetical protein [Thermosporothrix hazakensis]PZW36674.1 hypothetical protein EI42_00854 [Thermosporothrix hazakensis]BBH89142.1 hypothetical protein KTC_38930 [Thermosporothrix sp. COM3]GCE47325.1 hypothetical protein KTH_21940 [Thermosporothrix hazakensis]
MGISHLTSTSQITLLWVLLVVLLGWFITFAFLALRNKDQEAARLSHIHVTSTSQVTSRAILAATIPDTPAPVTEQQVVREQAALQPSRAAR